VASACCRRWKDDTERGDGEKRRGEEEKRRRGEEEKGARRIFGDPPGALFGIRIHASSLPFPASVFSPSPLLLFSSSPPLCDRPTYTLGGHWDIVES
jgi:hypothetical protein